MHLREDLIPATGRGRPWRSVAVAAAAAAAAVAIVVPTVVGSGADTGASPPDASSDRTRAVDRADPRPSRAPRADDGWPTPGHVDGLRVEGERFVSDGTASVLEQQPSPDLPRNFAPAGAPTAAAYVEQDGVRYLVLYRNAHGDEQLIAVESAGHGDSLDALLAWARQRYEDEVGLL